MDVLMTAGEILGIAASGIAAGAGILLILIGMISNHQEEPMGGGCLAVGLLMIGVAVYAAVRIMAKA